MFNKIRNLLFNKKSINSNPANSAGVLLRSEGNSTPKETFFSLLKTIVFAISFAVLFRTFVYDPFHIPSGSMMPTLYSGDKIFVNKFYYGYCASSLPFNIIPFKGRILSFRKPQRGEVIVFAKFDENSSKSYYIKRVIGLPGDVIEMSNNILTVNGERSIYDKTRRVLANTLDNENSFTVDEFHEKNKQIGYSHDVFKAVYNLDGGKMKKYVVPADQYFVMGDNRDNSMDSRYETEVGYINSDKIVGKADMIFFSAEGGRRFTFNPFKIRGKRIFRLINKRYSEK